MPNGYLLKIGLLKALKDLCKKFLIFINGISRLGNVLCLRMYERKSDTNIW